MAWLVQESRQLRALSPADTLIKSVLASFFSRGGGDVSHTGKFFTSFASQLARNVSQIQRFISDAVIAE
jgi:hypothetical protein